MQTITDGLDLVTGGMGPGPGGPGGGPGGAGGPGGGGGGGGDLGSWLPQDAGSIKSAESFASPQQGSSQFQSPNMNVTSGQDQSWAQGLPGMFSAMGM